MTLLKPHPRTISSLHIISGRLLERQTWNRESIPFLVLLFLRLPQKLSCWIFWEGSVTGGSEEFMHCARRNSCSLARDDALVLGEAFPIFQHDSLLSCSLFFL